jgi:hypothetical protein
MSRPRVLKTVGRVAALALLLVAMAGPSAIDIHPAQEESCSAPLVWLGDGRCACKVSLMSWLGDGFGPGGMLAEMVSGGCRLDAGCIANNVAMLIILSLPLLPFLSTLLLFVGGERRGLWVFHLVAWGLAAAVSAFLLAASWWGQGEGRLRLWGGWLCAVLAVAVLAGEILAARLRPSRKARPAAAGTG